MKHLSASLEDYLEIICHLLEKSKNIKAVEIARELNISRASVSEALTKLDEKGLIVYKSYKGITITEAGLKAAKNVINKHKMLTSFFVKTLGLDEEEASENACRIEHVISEELFKRTQAFQEYNDEHVEYINNFKKGYREKGSNEQLPSIR